MRASLIARNYAETLLALAQKHGGRETIEEYGRAANLLAQLLEQEPRVQAFLESPGISQDAKKRALRASFEGRVPPLFLRFVLVVVDRHRERLFREIVSAYYALVDEMLGRARADITLAEPADDALRRDLLQWLERRLGKTVVPRFRVDPELLGGVMIQVGDEVLDGSLRRRFSEIRQRLLDARLPEPVSG